MIDSFDLEVPDRVLVIAAHPDDAEFHAGATLAKWSRMGAEVSHLVLTDGSKGTWDPDADQAELVERRKEEQQCAAAALGANGEVVFLNAVDGELDAGLSRRGQVAEVIRQLRPTVILGHDPWKRYRLHPDHHAAGQLCVDGVVAARDPFFYREQLNAGLEPHRPEALLLFEPDEANHAEIVLEADHQRRIAALEAHQSQVETTHFYKLSTDEPLEGFRQREREQLERSGAEVGQPMAELYRLIVEQL
ncbi:MAG: PIG-L deacetylase family protein [Microthrixaceae bacterium]